MEVIKNEKIGKDKLNYFKRFGSYLEPYKWDMLKIFFAILISNVLALLSPVFTQNVIDVIIPSEDLSALVKMCILFLVTNIISATFLKYRTYNLSVLGQSVLKDLRYDVFTHLQRLPFSFFDTRPHGSILTRVVNYINNLGDILSGGLINLLSDILNLVIALVFMFSIDWKLTLYSLIFIPLLLVIVANIQKLQRAASSELSDVQSSFTAFLHESISGIYITQSFVKEDDRQKDFININRRYRDRWMKSTEINFRLGPNVQLISTLTTAVLYYVGVKAIGINVSTGTLIAFLGFINYFWNPIISIGDFYSQLVKAGVYLERIFELLDLEPEVKDESGASILPEVKGEVEFESVYFAYEDDNYILKDVSFKVDAGETVALVGPTGAGKSTVINLLSRFYNINKGTIRIDGHDISKVTLESLRKQVGVMLQDTFIFSGTIRENIQYGNLDASFEEVVEASKAVRAHDFIINLKHGYDTVVEERGSSLSAGQRQLIALARTLLADPKILILDEATSSIDTKTEELLQKGLDHLMEGRTSLVIAHRLATIKNADTIMYIEAGQVKESGSHDELMEKRGAYYRLYQSQYNILTMDE